MSWKPHKVLGSYVRPLGHKYTNHTVPFLVATMKSVVPQQKYKNLKKLRHQEQVVMKCIKKWANIKKNLIIYIKFKFSQEIH